MRSLRSLAFGVGATMLILVSGCSEPTLPDTPAGSSRAMMENPLGAAAAAKAKKSNAKADAINAAAAKADPRGH